MQNIIYTLLFELVKTSSIEFQISRHLLLYKGINQIIMVIQVNNKIRQTLRYIYVYMILDNTT